MKKYLLLAIVMLVVTGCQTVYETDEGWRLRTPVIVELEQVIYWLQATNDYMALTPAEAQQRLSKFNLTKKSRFNYFRYALLNQQLGTREGWVRARDTLRSMSEDKDLNEDLFWITRIFLQYNQSLINADEKQQRLTTELLESQQAELLLEDKIRAITNLEQSISERKEQTTEDAQTPGAKRE